MRAGLEIPEIQPSLARKFIDVYGDVGRQWIARFPALVDRYLAGDLMLDELVSGRRPLEDAEAALQDLAAGRTLRTLLIPDM